MGVRPDFRQGWRLVGRESSRPEAALAAEELEAALGAPGADGVEIALSHGGGSGDGFRRAATTERIELHGESPRGLLFAVYATLEDLGARWPWPGEERRPGDEGELEERVDARPALPGRCLVLGERVLVDAAEDWIAWAARNRLNGLFVHVSTSREPAGAAPEAAWRERRVRAVAMARERGMRLEHGGHLLPELLSSDDVRQLAEGRLPGGAARRTLEEHVGSHPEAAVLHLWGADLAAGVGGGREASEAALRTANALGEFAEAVRPGAEVAFLAYHDTAEVPRGVSPRANVGLVFAPRERCYEHALADPACRTNAHFRNLLERQIEHFDAAGAPPPRAFEYWFDAIRFPDGIPDLTGPIADDLAYYRNAGVDTVQMLSTGHGGPPSPHPNPQAFARLAWDPDAGRSHRRDAGASRRR